MPLGFVLVKRAADGFFPSAARLFARGDERFDGEVRLDVVGQFVGGNLGESIDLGAEAFFQAGLYGFAQQLAKRVTRHRGGFAVEDLRYFEVQEIGAWRTILTSVFVATIVVS